MKPSMDDRELAARWREVAAALEPAAEAWSAVSPESADPVRELLRDARWNAHVFQRLADGVPRPAAWRDADAEVGPRPDPRHVHYDPPVADAMDEFGT
jgi:hypothetical protein